MRDPIVEALVNKDPGALAAFSDAYQKLIVQTASQVLRDRVEVEDVLQEVLWTVYRKAHTFKNTGDFSSWVRQVTRNAARMQGRKMARSPQPLQDKHLREMIHANPLCFAEIPSPESILRLRQTSARLEDTFESLPTINRRVFWMMDVEGTPKEEAAENLGITVPALKSRLHRVRRVLRESAEASL